MRQTKSASTVIFRQLLFGAVVSLGASIAAATTARAQAVYYGCENRETGALRLIATDGPCKASETLISFSSVGPAGSSDPLQTQIVSQTQAVCACGCDPTATSPCPLASASVPVEAQCPTGDVVLGGGFNLAPVAVPSPTPTPVPPPTAGPLNPVAPVPAQPLQVIQSAPNEAGNAWNVSVAIPEAVDLVCFIGNCTNVTAWAICTPGTATGPSSRADRFGATLISRRVGGLSACALDDFL